MPEFTMRDLLDYYAGRLDEAVAREFELARKDDPHVKALFDLLKEEIESSMELNSAAEPSAIPSVGLVDDGFVNIEQGSSDVADSGILAERRGAMVDHIKHEVAPPTTTEADPATAAVPELATATASEVAASPEGRPSNRASLIWQAIAGRLSVWSRKNPPARTDATVLAGSLAEYGKTLTVSRRALAASIAGTCVGTWLLNDKLHAEVRVENVELRRRRDEIRRLVGAFSLANDDPRDGRIGPAALLSGPDSAMVTGFVDPDIIERVVIEWTPGDSETIAFQAKEKSDAAAQIDFIPFSREHAYQAVSGQVVRVRVQAIPRKDKADDLAALGRSHKWLTRHAEFLSTPFGLVAVSDQDGFVFNLPANGVLTQDRFALQGSIRGKRIDGALAVLFRAPDQRLYLLHPPVRVGGDEQIPTIILDFDSFYSGEGTLQFMLFRKDTPALATLESWDRSVPLEVEPTSLRRRDVLVTLKFPPRSVRIWRRVQQVGGTAKAHDGDWVTDESQFNARTDWQEISFVGCPIRDISILRGLVNLQGLSLSQTLIRDVALRDVARAHPQLMWLYLGSTDITDKAVVEELVKCQNLTALDLQNVRSIGNDSIAAIVRAYMPDLNFLNVSNTNVTSVLALRELKSLKTLHVRGCRIAEEELTELSKSRPDLKIHR